MARLERFAPVVNNFLDKPQNTANIFLERRYNSRFLRGSREHVSLLLGRTKLANVNEAAVKSSSGW